MCFTNDNCDWYASVQITSQEPLSKQQYCIECNRLMSIGEEAVHVYMQEYEECRMCADAEPGDGHDPATCQHDYGETFDCCQCIPCVHLLEAITAVEEEEGCPPDERRPMYGDLHQELINMRSFGHGIAQYIVKALEMYPELADHPIVKQMQEVPHA